MYRLEGSGRVDAFLTKSRHYVIRGAYAASRSLVKKALRLNGLPYW